MYSTILWRAIFIYNFYPYTVTIILVLLFTYWINNIDHITFFFLIILNKSGLKSVENLV